MKIIFTGASSFTGYWFIKELADAGHEITAIFRQSLDRYEGTRRLRIEKLLPICQPVFSCDFGSDLFFQIVDSRKSWDVFCHHAAEVKDYRSPQFDIHRALLNNTYRLKEILQLLMRKECSKVILTGSFFEQNEGEGTEPLRAFSPYGLSKGLTSDMFRFYSSTMGFYLGKFVIPNPFGPFEELRFTSSLIQQWQEKKIPLIHFPEYIRDNIHVSLLAKSYRRFISQDFLSSFEKFSPSGYRESLAAFTNRFASEMRSRLGLACEYHVDTQIDFSEPMVRINRDSICLNDLKWNEVHAWDDLASYYQYQFLGSEN